MGNVVRSPFFDTQREAEQWLIERPSAPMVWTGVYQTARRKRWRATWEEMDTEPFFTREAVILITKG